VIAGIGVLWLVRGRTTQRGRGAALLLGDTTPIPLTRPVILFAVIRAIAVAVAIPFLFGLPNADWIPIATLVAMRPSLRQSTLVAEQRLAGTIIGAGVAALSLLTVDRKIALGVFIIVLGALAGAVRTVNYAWYTAAVAGSQLIADGLPTSLQPC
jgi:uncharacterized membrane protein YgaE (UPF0421/DUF939 family)